MSFRQQAVQSGHAIHEADRQKITVHDGEHPHLILCEVPHEGKLLAAAERLRGLGLRIAEWREPDRNNELTAICSQIVYGDQRSHFKRYQLLKEPCAQPPASEAVDCCALSEGVPHV